MTVYHGRRGAISYGHSIGVLMIDCHIPFIPGDVGNARTFNYPVLYHALQDVGIQRLIDEGDMSMAPKVVDAARYLESQNVKAITSDCGFMLHFQQAVVEAVSVPVMLSSLLQLPFIGALLPASRKIGIITANGAKLSAELLRKAYPSANRETVVAGMENKASFRSSILLESGYLDSDATEREVIEVGQDLVRENPAIGAILVECSDLPPYSKALQDAVDLPIFDFTTMINFVEAAAVRRRFA